MGCGSDIENTVESIAAPVIDIGTAALAPELLPLVAPAVGAISGGLSGGIGGALTGGLEGGVVGQLGGVGDLAPLSSGASTGTDFLGLSTGGTSAIGGVFNSVGDALSGSSATPAVPTAGGDPSVTGSPSVSGGTGGTSSGGAITGGSAGATPAPAGISADTGSGDFPSSSTLNQPFGSGSTPTTTGSSTGPAQISPGGDTNLNTSASSALSASGGSPGNFNPGTTSSLGLDTSGTGGASGSGSSSSSLFGPSQSTVSAQNYLSSSPSAQVAQDVASAPDPTIQTIPAAAPAAPAGTGANAPNSVGQLFSDAPGGGFTMGNIGTALSKNSGLLVGAAGLGNDITTALSGPPKGTNQLTQEANQLQSLGQQNESYLQSGNLPTGVQAGINQASQSAIAAIKSKYAAMGMSGSSAEQSDIASVQQNAAVNGANIAMQLMNQGVSETGMSSNIYSELIKNTMASDQAFSSAFTNLATAVGGGGGGINLQLAKAS